MHKRWILAIVVMVGLVLSARSRPGLADAQDSAKHIAYIPLVFRQRPNVNEVFGVQMYGTTSSASPYYDALAGSGAQWVRAEANWKYVEPQNTSPANYVWGGLDPELAAARADQGSYNMLITVLGAPSWAATRSQGRIDKVSLSEFTDFVGALVERFDGDGFKDAPGSPVVRYWEFYNEPDHRDHWGNYPEAYAQMLGAVYPVLKAANPEAQLVFGGIAYDGFEDQGGPFVRSFLPRVFAAPGGDKFDIMNYHTYAAFWSNWANRGVGLLEKAGAVRQVMTSSGLSMRPLLVSETGWCSEGCNDPQSKPKTEQYQARYAVALLTQSLAARLDVMIWWMLHDLPPARAGHLYAFGLVTDDQLPQPKLAHSAYKAAVAKLVKASFERAWTDSETGHNMIEFYQFENNSCGCRLYVGWLNPLETADTKTLYVSHSQVKVYESINGSLIATLKDSDDGVIDGRTRVTVTGAPRYFEGH